MARDDELHELRRAMTELRERRGLSQLQVARRMNRSTRSAVGKLEGGESTDRTVTLGVLSRWANALDAHLRLDIINGVITVTYLGDANDEHEVAA